MNSCLDCSINQDLVCVCVCVGGGRGKRRRDKWNEAPSTCAHTQKQDNLDD